MFTVSSLGISPSNGLIVSLIKLMLDTKINTATMNNAILSIFTLPSLNIYISVDVSTANVVIESFNESFEFAYNVSESTA